MTTRIGDAAGKSLRTASRTTSIGTNSEPPGSRRLDERLRREAKPPALAEAARDALLAEYYAAFFDPSAGAARTQTECERECEEPTHEESLRTGDQLGREAIRRKHQALDGFKAAYARIVSQLSPDNLVLDASHDMYLTDSRLVFAKDGCHADDAERLFAQATPIDASVLPRTQNHLRMGRHGRPLRDEGKCIARYHLPRMPISHILVGQRDSAKAILWSGEIVLDRAAFEKTLAAMLAAAGEPVIESGMDVHVHGQRIFYVSDDCEGTDGRTPFFLHAVPMREADLPAERRGHGYDSLDFHQAGVTFGERCIVRWQLPDYPIRRIRTGQSVEVRDGEEVLLHRLWEGEADIGNDPGRTTGGSSA